MNNATCLREGRPILLAGLLIVILSCMAPVFADGIKIPTVAINKLPGIPFQRAIIAHHEGVETLIIESTLDGEGEEFAWIIPVPSEPTQFEEASPGLFRTLELALQPDIVHRVNIVFTACFLALGILAWAHSVAGKDKMFPVGGISALLLMTYIFHAILNPHVDGIVGIYANTSIPAGVAVEQSVQVGSYDLTVLQAESAEDLSAWLSGNGFMKLPAASEPIVSDYIVKDWHFVAAKLRREGSGFSQPHPLAMTFAADTPVYPMRLTRLADSDLYLELYVIADQQAKAVGLSREFCERYGSGMERVSGVTGFHARSSSYGIGLPSLVEIIWDECVITKLSETLRPDQMTKDTVLRMVPFLRFQRRVYSDKGAKATAMTYGATFWCLAVVVSMVCFRKRVHDHHDGRRFVVTRILLPVLSVSLAVAGVTYMLTPKVEVLSDDRGKPYPADAGHSIGDVEGVLRSVPDHFEKMTPEEAQKWLGEYFKGARNKVTGEPVRHEDSPGNYVVLEDERGLVLRGFSGVRRMRFVGVPHDIVLRK